MVRIPNRFLFCGTFYFSAKGPRAKKGKIAGSIGGGEFMLERWLNCIARLESEMPSEQFRPWIKPLKYIGYDESSHKLRVAVSSAFKRNLIRDQFEDQLLQVVREIFSPQTYLSLELQAFSDDDLASDDTSATEIATPGASANASASASASAAAHSHSAQRPAAPEIDEPRHFDSHSRLRRDLTLAEFVEGRGNQMALASAMQIIEKPGFLYNPLVVVGGVGLGKTHLLHAVGNALHAQRPGRKIQYVHAQEYFEEMVRAIQRKNPQDFKQHYQNLDLLLIDDIQFLGGKERTQEEFFYTFEALFSSRKQLMITCDTYPKELGEFQDRLKSRLASGLIVEIESPDLETRTAILLKKAEGMGSTLPQDAAEFIAKNLRSNVRELEGALLRVIAFARFRNRNITVEMAREALNDLLELNRPPVSIEQIQKVVADHYKIKVADMYSKRRPAHIALARQVAMYFAKELTQKSYPEIGEAFGGRDHTTVIHAVKKIIDLRQKAPEENRSLHVLEQTLKG
jgi:chromosomal replication initiator protein